jgi:hypothetical protein
MKVAVFISSHICYQGQLTLLSQALQSVLSQTIIPHVYISLSFADEMVEMANAAKRDIKSPGRAWKVHSKQRFQLQHLEYLTNMYADQYDMILFLDDDDTYATNRVQVMQYIFSQALQHCGHSKPICVREITNDGEHCDMPEYWAYGVQPLILRDFFKEIRERQLLEYIWNKMGDMVLRSYLRFKDIPFVGIPQQLYLYNKSNPFGVCNSQRREPPIEYDPKIYKRHQLQQITNLASYATNGTGIYSIEELFKRVQKTVDGPHKESYYPQILKLCLSAQKLIDYYNELRAWAQ